MKQLYRLLDRDFLILNKIGLILGSLLGFVGGLIISERAARAMALFEEEVEDDDGSDEASEQ